MPLTLHVWAPGFGLPSIDPQCLAAILYLQQTVPRDQWALEATSDDTISPTRKLPALQDDQQWIGGFRNIVDYLKEREEESFDLDEDKDTFGRTEKADITAFTSHILANGAPLLDAYLFVSSENYINTTRPAYSQILRWPMTWTVTPAIYSRAQTRTEHLGLSSADSVTAGGKEHGQASTAATGIVPDSLRTTKQSLTSLVRRPETASRFKLEALADRFLGPLDSLLGDKKYMVSRSRISSLDCVAYAYLASMLKPQVPQPWLREIIEDRYRKLREYVDLVTTECFQGSVTMDDALCGLDSTPKRSPDFNNDSSKLPWRKPQSPSVPGKVSVFAASSISNPLDSPIVQSGTATGKPSPPATVALLFGLLGVVTSLGGYLGFAYNEAQRPRQRLSDMGEAGAMLGSLDFGMGGGGIPDTGNTALSSGANEMIFRRK